MTPEQAHSLVELYEALDWQIELPEPKCLNKWLRPHEAGANPNCGICHPEIVPEGGGFGVLDALDWQLELPEPQDKE